MKSPPNMLSLRNSEWCNEVVNCYERRAELVFVMTLVSLTRVASQ